MLFADLKKIFFQKTWKFSPGPPLPQKKFFFSDIDQNTKYRGLRCSSTTLVKFLPDPPPLPPLKYRKKNFFLIFSRWFRKYILVLCSEKKNFFSVLSTTFLKYRKKSMSNFKKKIFFIGDQNKHDFYRFGMFLYNFGKKNFFRKNF